MNADKSQRSNASGFWKRHWFLLSLAILFFVGFRHASTLAPLTQWHVARSVLVAAVMFCAAACIRLAAIRDLAAKPLPGLLGITLNIVLVPLLACVTAVLFSRSWSAGLIVAALMPCTLASATVWTGKAGGNESIAMLVTAITNLACVITIPVGLWVATQWIEFPVSQVRISVTDQFTKLGLFVVLPLLLAQGIRGSRTAAEWIDKRKWGFSTLAQIGILAMVFIGAITSGNRYLAEPETTISGMGLIEILFATSGIHLSVLFLGIIISRAVRLAPSSQIAVAISGSQKTLMVGLQIALDCGVSIIPMLVFHVSQLFLDTMIATRWQRNHIDA